MSTRYVSSDGHWTVTVVSLNGRQRIRVTHDTVLLSDGHAVPAHQVDARRCGTVRMADGFLVANLTDVAEVERYVPLAELTRLKA